MLVPSRVIVLATEIHGIALMDDAIVLDKENNKS